MPQKGFVFLDRRSNIRYDEWDEIMSQEWKPVQIIILQLFFDGGNEPITNLEIASYLKGGFAPTIIDKINNVLRSSRLPYRIEKTKWEVGPHLVVHYKMYARPGAREIVK